LMGTKLQNSPYNASRIGRFFDGDDIDIGPNPAGLMRTFSSAKPITRISFKYF